MIEGWRTAGADLSDAVVIRPSGKPVEGLRVITNYAEAALEECERFYPVFQFVLWGGKSPGEAIAAALIDTHGEA